MQNHSLLEIKNTGYVWEPQPVNIWLSREPHNPLQAHIYQQLRERFEARGCIFVDSPTQPTELGRGAQLGIVFGRDLDEEISPLELLGQLPKPRGMMLIINTVDQIPPMRLFDLARGQLVRKAGHTGILAEGDLNGTRINRALWASMPGNNRLLEGDQAEMLDLLALRALAHASGEKVNEQAGEVEGKMSWDEWCDLPIHDEIARTARALGAVGIIEDEVPLWQYGTGSQVKSVLRFLKRAALGEGMRSQILPEHRIMGVTTSGGNKISVSADPHDGHIVPISQLTWTGYIIAMPRGCPIRYISPSVETHENGMVYLASALVNAGIVNSLDGFISYARAQFEQHGHLDVIPAGMMPSVRVLDHFHRQPKAGTIKDTGRVEVVYPDTSRFPEIDFPCGVREAEMHLLSAFFQSETFCTPGPWGEKLVIAVLPGHGSVAGHGGTRDELTDVLVNGMEMEEIVRI